MYPMYFGFKNPQSFLKTYLLLMAVDCKTYWCIKDILFPNVKRFLWEKNFFRETKTSSADPTAGAALGVAPTSTQFWELKMKCGAAIREVQRER